MAPGEDDSGEHGDEQEPVQQELAPMDGGERLARVEELREALEETEHGDA